MIADVRKLYMPLSYSTDRVVDAFERAYMKGKENYTAALCLSAHHHSRLSTGLHILALEEIGKMMVIDGLLFARGGDVRHKRASKAQKDHSTKLSALQHLPLFIEYLSTIDPRYNESRFISAKKFIIMDLRQKLQEVASLSVRDDIAQWLNDIKQQSFYSTAIGLPEEFSQLEFPATTVTGISGLSWRVFDSLSFILDLSAYRNRFIALRSKISPSDLETLKAQFQALFGDEEQK